MIRPKANAIATLGVQPRAPSPNLAICIRPATETAMIKSMDSMRRLRL